MDDVLSKAVELAKEDIIGYLMKSVNRNVSLIVSMTNDLKTCVKEEKSQHLRILIQKHELELKAIEYMIIRIKE